MTRFYHQDELGNVIGLTRGSTLDQALAYEPWGEVSTITGTVADTNRLRWKGMLWEGGNTRLYYVRNRWYDPEARRFTSEDPIGIDGGLNVYAFAGNDPVNNADPSGLEYCRWVYSHSIFVNDLILDVDERVCDDRDRGTARSPGGRGSWPTARDGGAPGGTIGPRSGGGVPTLLESQRTEALVACTAAALDAGLAVGADLFSLTGFGMIVTKGTRGARLARKLLRGSQWLAQERGLGALTPSGSWGMRQMTRSMGSVIVGGGWIVGSPILQGDEFSILQEIKELMPGYNAASNLVNAYEKCVAR